MIKIKIAELAKKHGLNTAYALQKALDMPPTMASRLFKGDFDKIGIGTIEKLCEYFGCQPDAFLEYPFAPVNNTQASNTQISNDVERATQSGNTKLSNNTQASNTQSNKTQTASDNEKKSLPSAVKKQAKPEKIVNLPELPNGDRWLKTAEIAERLGIKAHSTVRDFYNKQGLAHTRLGMVSYVKESDLNAFLENRKARGKS
jgi:DNA-binding Xre family transcriptional regulator